MCTVCVECVIVLCGVYVCVLYDTCLCCMLCVLCCVVRVSYRDKHTGISSPALVSPLPGSYDCISI